MDNNACSGCGASLQEGEGIEQWATRFCSACFIGNAAKLHRELRPEDIAALRAFGRELAGLLPPDLVEMVAIGFYRRSTGKKDHPPGEELIRFVGEIQRLVAFSVSRKVLNLLQSLRNEINQFVEGQEDEIRENIKRLTDFQ